METSNKGIELIQKFEGLRLTAYKCPAGVWTIGYGHTKGVQPDMKINLAQATQFLKEDLKSSEKYVNQYVKVAINQNQFDALVSFTFNCGCGALKSSTLLKKLNKGDYLGAANEFLRWNKSNGKVLNGLVKRRKAEKELFLTPIESKNTYYIVKKGDTLSGIAKKYKTTVNKLRALNNFKSQTLQIGQKVRVQ